MNLTPRQKQVVCEAAPVYSIGPAVSITIHHEQLCRMSREKLKKLAEFICALSFLLKEQQ